LIVVIIDLNIYLVSTVMAEDTFKAVKIQADKFCLTTGAIKILFFDFSKPLILSTIN